MFLFTDIFIIRESGIDFIIYQESRFAIKFQSILECNFFMLDAQVKFIKVLQYQVLYLFNYFMFYIRKTLK